MSDKGKLAETLAESIAEKLGDSDMFLDKRFDSIMASLNSIQWGEMSLKRVYDSQELYNNHVLELITAAAKVIDSKSNKSVNKQETNADTNKKTETSENEESEDTLGVETTDDKTPIRTKINRLETNQYRILGGIDNIKKDNKKNTESAIKKSEERIQTRTIRMERSIKRTIKSRLGKLWSMFKKVLVVGLLLFFAPAIKNAFAKIGDKLAYVFEPMVNWFTKNFPVLTGYIKDLTAYVGNLASDFGWIVDKLKTALDFTEDHGGAITGVSAGAGIGGTIGLAFGPLGAAIGAGIGGAIGGLIGDTIDRMDPDGFTKEERAAHTQGKEILKSEGWTDEQIENADNDYLIYRGQNSVKAEEIKIKEGADLRIVTPDEIDILNNNDSIQHNPFKTPRNDRISVDENGNIITTRRSWDDAKKDFDLNSGGEDFNPASQGGEGGATPKEPLSATSFQQHQYININNNNIVVTEQPLFS